MLRCCIVREYSRERRKTDEGQKMRTMEKGKEENDLAGFFFFFFNL